MAGSFAFAGGSQPAGTPVLIPNGESGVGFDDLRYSAALHRVLVPAGRTGTLTLIDPTTAAVSSIPGFSASPSYAGGHDFGVTSVDEGGGFLFATDRSSRRLHVINPKTGKTVSSAPLAAEPDYVRFVASKHELWVTEPDAAQIEIFSLTDGTPAALPAPHSVATIAVSNGPESLVIDDAHGRAYTHRWQAFSLAIDLSARSIVAQWPNACEASRGIAYDAAQGFLIAICNEGTVSVLDALHGGRALHKKRSGSGYDVVGWNPKLRHLYLAGRACACLTIVAISETGKIKVLGSLQAPVSTHCAVADDSDGIWVCDPSKGRMLQVHDPYPASR